MSRRGKLLVAVTVFFFGNLYSQSGWRLAYVHWQDTIHNENRINLMNLDGSHSQTIINYPGIEPLVSMDDLEQHGYDISPDGKLIAFTGRKKGARNFDLYIVHADGSNLIQLTNDWKRKVQPFFINQF